MMSVTCADERATLSFGARVAAALEPCTVIYLRGDLGAGKTTLTRALIQALASGTRVKSPTYTLIESYQLPAFILHHLDLYRVADPAELDYLGVRDLGADGAVIAVEWPEHGAGWLPAADLDISMEVVGAGRQIAIGAPTVRGTRVLERLRVG